MAKATPEVQTRAPVVEYDVLVGRLSLLAGRHLALQMRIPNAEDNPLELMSLRQEETEIEREAKGFLALLESQYGQKITLEKFLKEGKKALARNSPYGADATLSLMAADITPEREDYTPLDVASRVNDPPPPRSGGKATGARGKGSGLGVRTPEPPPSGTSGRPPEPVALPLYIPPPVVARLAIDKNRAQGDFTYFCAEVLECPYRIPVNGKLSGPLFLNDQQKALATVLITVFLIQKKPLRMVILKARQLGITTLLLAFWVWVATYHPNFRLIFIIDKNEHNASKLRMVRLWIEKLIPERLEIKAFFKQDGNQIVFSNGSVFFFESAEADNPGSSESSNAIHQSEKSKWPRGKGQLIANSLLPALPLAEFTASVNESTALGLDDFEADWQAAMVPKSERTELTPIPIFMPWFVSSEYSLPVPPDFEFSTDERFFDLGDDGVTRTEQEASRRYKWSDGQVLWRRAKILELGDVEAFDQEYPSTPKHAFRASGNNYFPQVLLAKQEKEAKLAPAPRRGSLRSAMYLPPESIPKYNDPLSLNFFEDPQGESYVFETPLRGKKYVIGVDTAKGLEPKNSHKSNQTDPTVFSIKYLDSGIPVCYFVSRREPEVLFRDLLYHGVWYNLAFINAELDGPGQTLRSWFLQTRYPNVMVYPEPKSRPVHQRVWTYLGGGDQKRDTYLSALRSMVIQDPRRLRWLTQIYEYMSFIRDPRTGRPKAANGKHDDIIFADMHAEIMRSFLLGFFKSQVGSDGTKTLVLDEASIKAVTQPLESEEGRYRTSDVMTFDSGEDLDGLLNF